MSEMSKNRVHDMEFCEAGNLLFRLTLFPIEKNDLVFNRALWS